MDDHSEVAGVVFWHWGEDRRCEGTTCCDGGVNISILVNEQAQHVELRGLAVGALREHCDSQTGPHGSQCQGLVAQRPHHAIERYRTVTPATVSQVSQHKFKPGSNVGQ